MLLVGKKFHRAANKRGARWIFSIEMKTTALNMTWKSLDDKALIDLTLAGRTECFDALMARHIGVVKARVHALVQTLAEAEDVVQEVQLKAWLHLSSFRSASSFRTWLTRIAINESLQFHRRAKQGRVREEVNLETFTAKGDSPFQSYARRQMAGVVQNAIGRLPSKFRQILILRDLQELSVKETARHLNANPQMVKTRLFRARIMLSKSLQREHANDDGAPVEMKTPAVDWHSEIAA